MRISDWSSDVCSSDLGRARRRDGRWGTRSSRAPWEGRAGVGKRRGWLHLLESLQDDRRDLLHRDRRGVDDRQRVALEHLRGAAQFDGALLQRGIARVRPPLVKIGRAHVELQSLMRISSAGFCLNNKKQEKYR